MDMMATEYTLTPHISKYDSEEYNEKMEAVFEEKDAAARATLLHEAEEMIIEDMAVIPVVFNQNATITSKELSKVKATYYCPAIFTKTKLKNYEDYLPVEE
jgi:ABC-type transport system substrate-binding protein